MQVESAALNEASHTDKGPCGKKDGPVFHTRGLTLSEEHRYGDQAVAALLPFSGHNVLGITVRRFVSRIKPCRYHLNPPHCRRRSIRTVMGSRRDGNRLISIVPQFSTVADSRWEV
jgi:hypothetical protein